MEEKFNKIKILEKEGTGKIFLDDNLIKGLTSYNIKRNTDMIDITLNISVPPKNLETIY